MYVYVCHAAGYRDIVMQSLPQLSILDGLDRLGNLSHPSLGSLCDVPGLEDYVDLLLSSDTSQNEAVIIDATPTVNFDNNYLNRLTICSYFCQNPKMHKLNLQFHTKPITGPGRPER